MNLNSLTLSYVDGIYDKQPPRKITDIDDLLNLQYVSSERSNKLEQPALIPFYGKTRKKTDFDQSNVAFVDIDTAVFTNRIIGIKDILFNRLQNIIFIQESFSGKLHICFSIDTCYDIESYVKTVSDFHYALTLVLIEELKLNDVEQNILFESIDEHSFKPTQLSFVSNKEIIVNSKWSANADEQCVLRRIVGVSQNGKPRVTLLSLPVLFYKSVAYKENDKSVTLFCVDEVPNTPSSEGVDVLFDFLVKSNELNCVKQELLRILEEIKDNGYYTENGQRLLKPHYYGTAGIVNIKLNLKLKYTNGEPIKYKEGQHRRFKMKYWIKCVILNALATMHYYDTDITILCNDIIATIKWLMLNFIELKGTKRSYGFSNIKEWIVETIDCWDSINIDYRTNCTIGVEYENETTQQYANKCKMFKYGKIEDMFLDCYNTYGFDTMSINQMVDFLNQNNFISKSSSKWNYQKVYKQLTKLGKQNSSNDINEYVVSLKDKGMSVSEIANYLNDNGYVTKTGKPFTNKGVGMIIKRYVDKFLNDYFTE